MYYRKNVSFSERFHQKFILNYHGDNFSKELEIYYELGKNMDNKKLSEVIEENEKLLIAINVKEKLLQELNLQLSYYKKERVKKNTERIETYKDVIDKYDIKGYDLEYLIERKAFFVKQLKEAKMEVQLRGYSNYNSKIRFEWEHKNFCEKTDIKMSLREFTSFFGDINQDVKNKELHVENQTRLQLK